MRSMTLIALSALALGAAAPAFAQDAMASHDQMKSGDKMATTKKPAADNMKSHDAMSTGKKKHAKPAKKAHSDMMSHDAMKHGN